MIKNESLHNVQTWQKYETKFYLNGKQKLNMGQLQWEIFIKLQLQ